MQSNRYKKKFDVPNEIFTGIGIKVSAYFKKVILFRG
jgi:hypothetical protein